jgi:hypothetical protein
MLLGSLAVAGALGATVTAAHKAAGGHHPPAMAHPAPWRPHKKDELIARKVRQTVALSRIIHVQ